MPCIPWVWVWGAFHSADLSAQGFLHPPLNHSLLQMSPIIFTYRASDPSPPPLHLIAVDCRNIIASHQTSPHTLSTVVLFTIHTCYIQLLLLCTTFIRFIKLPPPPPPGNDPFSENDPLTPMMTFMISQQSAPFPQVINNQLQARKIQVKN